MKPMMPKQKMPMKPMMPEKQMPKPKEMQDMHQKMHGALLKEQKK